jgi:excisionase family DNA binding protein
MPRRDFYTLQEAAQLLEMAQRHLLERLESGEIEGERDPQSGRWKVSRQAVDELVSEEVPSAEDPAEEPLKRSAKMLRGLVDELGELHRQVGHLRSRLDRARRAEREEAERLQVELERERADHRRERERADRLQLEAATLREELENERRGKGSLRKLFGGPG